jgi:RNase H-fold protein (predicted Holliday junction resolvase)
VGRIMLGVGEPFDTALRELIKQWNIAEGRIKKAEQVRGNQIVSSAIYELRYAGRKIIDAIEITLEDPKLSSQEAKDKVHAQIADATEDCVKAKHDAIDAMMNFVTSWFNRAEQSLGLDKIQSFFPDYMETTALIADVQNKIAESRIDRNKLRDSIYDAIDKPGGGYDKIISLFDKMDQSAKRVEIVVKKERSEKKALWIVTIVSVVVALLALIEPGIHAYEHFTSKAVANTPSTDAKQGAPEKR